MKGPVPKARILTMPAPLGKSHVRHDRKGDPRYVEGQRLIVEAIRYLVKNDPESNTPAVKLLSEHFRTKFRMSDKPSAPQS